MDKKKLIIIGIILLIIVGVILFFLLKDDSSKTLELTYETSKGIPYRWEYEIEDDSIVKLKKAFVDSFKLLVKQNNIDTRNLFNEIKNAMRDNSPIEKIKELDNKKELLEKKKTKLVDFMLDETISKEVFEKKKKN